MHLTVAYDFLPKTPSAHAAVVMDHFGLGFETGQHVIADRLDVPLQPGDVVAFTGPSGSGKSSLLRAAAAQLDDVLSTDALALGDRILVDALDRPADETLGILSACGLGEAQLMLRTPDELSDGQRYRFRLALAVSQSPRWIVADEFTAALDRTLAKVIAFNLRKLATRTGIGFLIATTHEDILDDLQPDVHVQCGLDGDPVVKRVSAVPDCLVPSPPSSGERARVRGPSAFSIHPPLTVHETKDLKVSNMMGSARPLTPTLSPADGGEGAGKNAAVKKSHQLLGRALAVPRFRPRLAVFRSVALPQSPPRLRPLRHRAVARHATGRDLRVPNAAAGAAATVAVLRIERPLVADQAAGLEQATGDVVASGAASDLSRRGSGCDVHPRQLPGVSIAVDRNAGGDGAHQSVL